MPIDNPFFSDDFTENPGNQRDLALKTGKNWVRCFVLDNRIVRAYGLTSAGRANLFTGTTAASAAFYLGGSNSTRADVAIDSSFIRMASTSGRGSAYVFLRGQGSADSNSTFNAYAVRFSSASSSAFDILVALVRFDNGSEVTLWESTTPLVVTLSANNPFTFRAVNNVGGTAVDLTVTYGEGLSHSLTDSSPSAILVAGRGGVGFRNNVSAGDNFRVNALTFMQESSAGPATATVLEGAEDGVAGTPIALNIGINGTHAGVNVSFTTSSTGTFSPTSPVARNTATQMGTVNYTPTVAGTHTISVTNSGGLTNDTPLAIFVTEPDTTAPTLSGLSGTGGVGVCSGSVSTNDATGTIYLVVTASATTPLAAQVRNGQDHLGGAALRVATISPTATGAQAISSAPVTAGTRYWHAMHEDAEGNQSTVLSSSSFVVTAPSDTTPPTLSSPVGTKTGTTTATVGATTNEANGTMYYVVTNSATQPTVQQIKDGQNASGAAAYASGSQTITTTGAKTFPVTGLPSGTTFYAHLVHADAEGNDSNRVVSGSFTTDTATLAGFDFHTIPGFYFGDMVGAVTGLARATGNVEIIVYRADRTEAGHSDAIALNTLGRIPARWTHANLVVGTRYRVMAVDLATGDCCAATLTAT